MKEVVGDIWDFHGQGYWIVITTNGSVRKNGEAVMGRGIALQAKNKFPKVPKLLGKFIREGGNYVYLLGEDTRLISFPVKDNWWEKADINLIVNGCKDLVDVLDIPDIKKPIYLVRPGCGNGQLDWKDIKPILEKYLDDNFIVVERKNGY